MQNIQFPVQLVFNIGTLSNDFSAKDSRGDTIAYVRQKMLRLKEDIQVFEDESKAKENFRIKADRWIDWSAAYSITDSNSGQELGKVARKGWRSLFKAEYEIIDENQQMQYSIREDNGWVKVWDSLLGEIPILGLFTGYFFNPAYTVTDMNGNVMANIKKEASFFGRKFQITKPGQTDQDDDQRIILGLMMMVLMERRRG